MNVDELAQRLNVPVETANDDLDYFKAIIVDTAFGPIAFQQYRGMPDRSTLVICMEAQADTRKLLHDIASIFGIPAERFVWTCLSDQPSPR
ncbi:hypothetical protein ACM9HJ_25425 [Niveispirillum sp. KHB5.9]